MTCLQFVGGPADGMTREYHPDTLDGRHTVAVLVNEAARQGHGTPPATIHRYELALDDTADFQLAIYVEEDLTRDPHR